MTLTLTLANVDRLENGETTQFTLTRRGALIGRSPQAEWSLPDLKKHISFTHCEIVYRNGDYLLVDKSSNGTYLNGAHERLTEPHVLANGDEFAIGHYRVLVRVTTADGVEVQPRPKSQAGGGWDLSRPVQQLQPPGTSPSGARPQKPQPPPMPSPRAEIDGHDALSRNFVPPRFRSPPEEEPPRNAWTRLDEAGKIDWTGSFGPSRTPHEPPPVHGEPPEPPPYAGQPPVAPLDPPAPRGDGEDEAWDAFLKAAGLASADLKTTPRQAGAMTGSVLRRLVAGLVAMLESRAREKSELGVTATMIEKGGNNPLKFLRDPETAAARLIAPAERGFMDGERAVEDAFKDLQAHQKASLAAMRGALRETLARFSPRNIRNRADARGLLARVLPTARDAELWRAYEREFEGVVKDSDEAFLDYFAKTFREAYQKASKGMQQ